MMLGYSKSDLDEMINQLTAADNYLMKDMGGATEMRRGILLSRDFLEGLWAEGYFDNEYFDND